MVFVGYRPTDMISGRAVKVRAPGMSEVWLELGQWFEKNLVPLSRDNPGFEHSLEFLFPGHGSRPDDGLVRRTDPRTGSEEGDHKWFLHVRPWTPQYHKRWLPNLFDSVRDRVPGLNDIFPEFLDWHREVVRQAEEVRVLVSGFLTELEQACPGLDLVGQINHPEAQELHVVRFLYYDPRPVGSTLASLHKDFGLITADLAMSSEGLCLSPEEAFLHPDQIVSHRSDPDRVILFPGRKLDLVSRGKIPGLCHGVISTDDQPRLAMVAFFHGPGEMGPSCPS